MTVEECACPEEQTKEVSKKEMDEECPAGEHKNDEGKCVKDEPKEESIPKWAKDLQTSISSISGLAEKLTKLETDIGVRKPQPTAKVSSDKQFTLSEAIKKVERWIESDRDTSCTVTLPVDQLRSFNIKKVRTPQGVMEAYRSGFETDLKIKEALGYTGTQALQDADNDVALEAGGFSFVPVTQFAKYKEIQQGADRARFFKHDLPAPGTQTPGTTATIATMDIESIEVTPSTITGVHLEIDTDDIENNPYDTVSTVVKASAARFDDFIATDMLDTVSAEGTLTPHKWIKGSDGSVVTTSDASGIAMDSIGIAAGVQYLEDRGYLNGGVKPVCFLDPKQFRELVTDTGITNFTQFARPGITAGYEMAELYGCTLVRTNAIQHNSAQTNVGSNAIMCVPQHSYGVGSKRNVTIKFHEVPEDNQIWATTNWRIKSGVIDADSIIRISTTG